MAERMLHDLVLDDDGHGQAWVWSVAMKEDETGLQIRYGKANSRLKSQWIPAAKVTNNTLVGEALAIAQQKLADGYRARDGASSVSAATESTTGSIVAGAAGGEDQWFW